MNSEKEYSIDKDFQKIWSLHFLFFSIKTGLQNLIKTSEGGKSRTSKVQKYGEARGVPTSAEKY